MTIADTSQPAELRDLKPDAATFLADVLRGLSQPQKRLPCKYFYDKRGSRLFDRICELDEYYPTRTELAIMWCHVREMAQCLGPRCMVTEYGSGSSLKTRLLLEAMVEPAAYAPVEICREHLIAAAKSLARQFPQVRVLPICADFTSEFELPECGTNVRRKAVYFPGSTIGNFERPAAERLLRGMATLVGPGGGLLIGVDLLKDRRILEAAYNDSEGVTAAFNLNLLARINRELGADFDLDAFTHLAYFDEGKGRVEMHLVSKCSQMVTIAGRTMQFARGERIHTENSHKYTIEGFDELAGAAGWLPVFTWLDQDRLFSVRYCKAR